MSAMHFNGSIHINKKKKQEEGGEDEEAKGIARSSIKSIRHSAQSQTSLFYAENEMKIH